MSIKRQFFWSMLPLLIITAINFVSVPLFVRYLGHEMYALWGFVVTFTGMFGFADLGLGVAVGRYIAVALGKGDSAAVREYWGTGNLIAMPLLALVAMVFIGFGVWLGPIWFNKVKPENVRLFQWVFVCGGCSLFLSFYTQFWLVLSQAHLDFKFIGILRGCYTVVQVTFSLFLAYLTGNPVVLVLGSMCLGVVQLIVFVWHARHKYHLGLNLKDASFARAKEMSGYTTKTFASLIAGSFLGTIDRMVVGRLDPIAFVPYNICYNFGARIQGLSVAIMGPVFHQTSRAVGKGSRESAAAIYNETFNLVFGWYALVVAWVICWYPVFLRLWLGREPGLAESVAPAFAPLVAAFCLAAVANISSAQLASLDRMGVQLFFSVANNLALGLGVFVGWQWNGLAGVAWGVLTSRIVLIAQDLYVLRLIGAGGWLSPRTWKHLAGQCVVGLAFYCVSGLLPYEPAHSLSETLGQRIDGTKWQSMLAMLHGGLVAVWLLRQQIKKIFTTFGFWRFKAE